jgi:hypothetical protein
MFHSKTQLALASLKELVAVSTKTGRVFVCDSLEAVDGQLPLKGCVFCLVELSWHDNFGKFLRFVDPERVSVRLPRNDAFDTCSFNSIKHGMYLERQRKS